MSNKIMYPHPGYLYQVIRKSDEDQREKNLYLYLTPVDSTIANPLDNHRLQSVLKEVDIVVFDSPLEEGPKEVVEQLQKNYSKETLLRINSSLTESLKKRKIDMKK